MFVKVILTSTKLYLFIDPSRIDTEIINARSEITILPEEEFENILKASENIFVDDTIASAHIMDLIADKQVQKITDPCLIPKACKNEIEIKHAIDFHIKDAVALCEFFAGLDDYFRHCEKTQSVDEAISEKYDKIATQVLSTARNDTITEYSLGLKLNTQVLKGHITLAKATFPKNIITGANLDILARQYLWQEQKDYPHGTGHGVGSFLSVHARPQSINFVIKPYFKQV